MELNSFLFPAPQSSYTMHGSIGDILYIPRQYEINQELLEQRNLYQQAETIIQEESKDGKVLAMIEESETIIERQYKSEQLTARDSEGIRELPRELPQKKELQGTLTSRESKVVQQKTSTRKKKKKKIAVPCLYLPYTQGSSKLLIYFHGNAEDVGLATELLDYVRALLRVHVLGVEYPGYGIYDGQPDAYQIQKDAELVYDYLTLVQGIPESSIILFGRSIGTGPATYLASKKNPCSLLLMSPFTSIRDIVKETAGKYLQYVISDRFRNIDLIESVRCPTFIVHGQKDTLISYRHAQELHFKCGGPSALIMPKDMDHNEFDFIDDLIQPFYHFLKQCQITVDVPDGEKGHFDLPENLYIPPPDFPKQNSNSNFWNWILRKFM